MPAIRKTAVADAAGDDIQINDQTAFVTTHGLTTTVFQPQTPLPSGTYRARVRHVDAGGTYSVWWAPDLQLHIDTGAIEQITCPLAEALIASENLVPGWTSAATAMIYELWVSDLTTGAGRIIRETSLAEMAFTTVMQLAAGQYLAWFRAIGFVQLVSCNWGRQRSRGRDQRNRFHSGRIIDVPKSPLILHCSLFDREPGGPRSGSGTLPKFAIVRRNAGRCPRG